MSTVQVSARLSADATDFKSKLDDASSHAGKVATGIGKKFELRNLGTAMATALGINLQNMAEQVSRFATGMSRELEQAFKNLEALTDRVTDATIANMREMGNEETRYQLMLQERERILARLAAGQAKPGGDGPSFMARALDAVGKFSPVGKVLSMLGVDFGSRLRDENAAATFKSLEEDKLALTQLDGQIRKTEADREKDRAAEAEARAKWINSLVEGKVLTGEIADTEQARLETAEKITDAIEEQVEKLEEVKKQTIEITRLGREDADLSDRELARKVRNLQAGIAEVNRSKIGDPNIAAYLNQPAQLELTRTQGELDLRQQVRQLAARFGEERAFQQFNLSEQRFAEILRGATESSEQVKLLTRLNDKLEHGITVRPIPPPTI